jgi:hypothetical protein
MDNFLPILIGIIWVAYTLYNKGKKKKVVNQPQTSEQKDSKPLSIFEQILMGGEIRVPKPYADYFEPVETIPAPQKEQKSERIKNKKLPSPFLNEELAQFTDEGQSVSGIEQRDKSIDEILHEQDLEMIEKDFDIRKAVIYAEILNPPYIGYK